eukprot:1137494-Pelagomonas_calceolata.AAC.9
MCLCCVRLVCWLHGRGKLGCVSLCSAQAVQHAQVRFAWYAKSVSFRLSVLRVQPRIHWAVLTLPHLKALFTLNLKEAHPFSYFCHAAGARTLIQHTHDLGKLLGAAVAAAHAQRDSMQVRALAWSVLRHPCTSGRMFQNKCSAWWLEFVGHECCLIGSPRLLFCSPILSPVQMALQVAKWLLICAA